MRRQLPKKQIYGCQYSKNTHKKQGTKDLSSSESNCCNSVPGDNSEPGADGRAASPSTTCTGTAGETAAHDISAPNTSIIDTAKQILWNLVVPLAHVLNSKGRKKMYLYKINIRKSNKEQYQGSQLLR